MDVSPPASQNAEASSPVSDDTMLYARELYTYDLLLVAVKDRLRLDDFLFLVRVMGLLVIVGYPPEANH